MKMTTLRTTLIAAAAALISTAALAQETRLGIFRLLVQAGPEFALVGVIFGIKYA